MTLEQTQIAKVDLALGKCDLRPGMTLLDVGCGWGSTMLRATEHYDVNVIGLTPSRNQYQHVSELFSRLPRTGRTIERYDDFFAMCHDVLPADGRKLLHTIVGFGRKLRQMGIEITRQAIQFTRFVLKEIFPGGQLPLPDWVTEHAVKAGFTCERIQALQPHSARTLDCGAKALRAHHDEAVEVASEQVYRRYVRYLTGSADHFRSGRIDVMQFTLVT